MATRMYFNTTPQATQSQAVNSAWTGSYASFDRYFFESTPTSAFSTLTNTDSFASGGSYCFGQWWSHPINNMSSFTSADWNASTWTWLMRHTESSASANYVYKAQARIWSGGSFVTNSFFTGGTEFDVGAPGTLESRRCSACDFWGAVGPFSDGDRIVLEMGIYRTSGAAASFTAYSEIGGNNGSDLANNETGTTQLNPWFECSLNFTFDAEPSGEEEVDNLMMLGVS